MAWGDVNEVYSSAHENGLTILVGQFEPIASLQTQRQSERERFPFEAVAAQFRQKEREGESDSLQALEHPSSQDFLSFSF